MAASHLNAVPAEGEVYVMGKGPETRGERVRRMQENARALAREQIAAMIAQITELADTAQDVATGGEAYPVGVRELCSRLARELQAQARNVELLLQRS